jgi:hypothetical protein
MPLTATLSTPLWVLAGAAAYLALLVFTLSLLTLAKRADEAAARTAREHPPVADGPMPAAREPGAVIEASSSWLGRRVADAHAALGVERMLVVLRDPADRRTWVVEGCVGVPGLCGTAISGEVEGGFAWLLTSEGDDRLPWRVTSAAIAVDGAIVGEVAMATRRSRGLGAHDGELLERLAALVARRVREGDIHGASRRGAA